MAKERASEISNKAVELSALESVPVIEKEQKNLADLNLLVLKAEAEINFEEIIEKERASVPLRIRQFKEVVDKNCEALGVDAYFDTIEDFLEKTGSVLKGSELKPELQEKFDTLIRSLSSRFQKDLQPEYESWIEAQYAEPTSWLSLRRAEWVLQENLARSARRFSKLIETFDLSSKLRGANIDSKVISRVTGLEEAIVKASGGQKVDTYEIIREFLISSSLAGVEREKQRKPHFFERLTGKKEVTPEDEFQKRLKQLDPAFANKGDKFGLNNRKRLGSR
jgi:hypothetical protein